jgi:DNA replication protein DnaC
MAYLNGQQYHAEQGARPAHQTFENFLLMPGSRDAFNAAKVWVDPKAAFIWLLIYGGVGNGKSHLCNAALGTLLSGGVKAKLVTASQLLAQLRIAMADHTTDAVMAGYQSVPTLIIDDLGAGMKHPGEPASEWEWARIEELLVARYERLLPTMVVTNLDWASLPERIASRFDDRAIARRVENTAPDYRREK